MFQQVLCGSLILHIELQNGAHQRNQSLRVLLVDLRGLVLRE